MAELRPDRELLTEYAEQASESAFQSLVERHVNLVFATALRGLGDVGAAHEITQNVFITLARKAFWLHGQTSVVGWLHKTTLLEVRIWWRGELRRRRREQAAAELGTTMKEEPSLLKTLEGELDEGLLTLRETDRQALMLRYFEGRSHREIGVLLGAREDAVRMRINKALGRLTEFFRRRGHAVPAVATTVALLGASAKAAPATLASVASHSAMAAAGGGVSATGLKLLFIKFMGLSKTQTAVLGLALVAAPVAWEWNVNRITQNRAADSQSKLQIIHDKLYQSSADLDRLRAASARLDSALSEALDNQARYEVAGRKLEALKVRVRGMLADPNYHWPDDLPYVRVPKAVIKALDHDIMDRWPGTFRESGRLTDIALELFAITAQEQAQAEKALADYWHGVLQLMAANAYETNSPNLQPGRVEKTVIVPPLGQPLKTLADETRMSLTDVLGAEREKLLFDGWDKGGIQIFWPGNLWNVAEASQTFTAWVDQSTTSQPPPYGAGWHQGSGGTGPGPISTLPRGIATQFFLPWLSQFGITAPTGFFGDPHE